MAIQANLTPVQMEHVDVMRFVLFHQIRLDSPVFARLQLLAQRWESEGDRVIGDVSSACQGAFAAYVRNPAWCGDRVINFDSRVAATVLAIAIEEAVSLGTPGMF